MSQGICMRPYVARFALVFLLAIFASAAISIWLDHPRIIGVSGTLLVGAAAAAIRFVDDHGRLPERDEYRRFGRRAALGAVPIAIAALSTFALLRDGPAIWRHLDGLFSAPALGVLSVLVLVGAAAASYGLRWAFLWSSALRLRVRLRRRQA